MDDITILYTLHSLLNSSVNDYEKLFYFLNYFNTPNDFKKRYQEDTMNKELINDIYNKIKPIYKSDIKNNVKYYIKNRSNFYSLPYAETIINNYIKSDYSYDLLEMDIDYQDFTFFIKVIKELNVDLYNEYTEKKENNDKIYNWHKYYKIIHKFKLLAKCIETGYTSDNNIFDTIEFWKMVPFKNKLTIKDDFKLYNEHNNNINYSSILYYQIHNFTRYATPEIHSIIITYLRYNNIYDINYISEKKINYIYTKNNIVIKNQNNKSIRFICKDKLNELTDNEYVYNEITNGDIILIINYLKDNKIPFIKDCIDYIFNEYLHNNKELTKNYIKSR